MKILIYGYDYLTSSIWSGSPSEQIRNPASSGRGGFVISITRVWLSEADQTKKLEKGNILFPS